jgi:hypothetical protein
MKLWILVIIAISFNTHSKSIASFPKDLKHWILVKESMIPGKDVTLPEETPLFIQDTVKTYNWINNGKGTKLNIFVPKDKLEAYKTHGPYKDGPTAAGVYEDSDIIFITEHIEGEAIYGTYDRQGNDISDSHPTFQINMCQQCHVANEAICINGTCAQPIIDIFKDTIK